MSGIILGEIKLPLMMKRQELESTIAAYGLRDEQERIHS
jgi:hypothetical protein